ncbi:MAG TPA: winged helix-turn-helix domain-containing protein [Nitrososphaeraceae archaeon]|nr:winged helix-turn-helix domain-containing protein [Nitrososphaeraceae archaeon]
MSGSESSYRDRIYIVKDLILKLIEHNELNQTTLLSFCGLNLKKHKSILDDLEENNFINKTELPYGKRRMVIYKPTRKGIEFCTNILEPYEKVFPRRKTGISEVFNNIYQEDKGKELLETKNKALAKNTEE